MFKCYIALLIKIVCLNTETIRLIPEFKEANHGNYYSVLIGNNGTGKSTLLSEIAKKLKGGNDDISKVIAVSSSISDKFPMDKSYRLINRYNNSYSNMDYVYLGLRGSNNLFSTSAQFRKALEIFIENYAEREFSDGYRHLFEYLDYSPVIKIEYHISNIDEVEENIYHYIHNVSRPENYRTQISYDELLERYLITHNDVLDFVMSYEKNYGRNEIVLNFSRKNMNRIYNDYNIYQDEVTRYKVLEVLRRLRVVRRVNYKIYKNDGLEMDFKEASSGEIAILSTLFALIPLVEDSSLILIDEPEISLHPYWQSQYIRLLDKILEDKIGCHTIIATHSHLMLSDLPIERSSIISFLRKGKRVKVDFLEESTFGWSAENILLNVFGVPSTRNYYLSNLVSEALILIRDRKKDTNQFNSILSDLKEYRPHLKEDDPLKDIIETIVEVM